MKQWKYPLNSIVKVNKNAAKDMEATVGLYGTILDLLNSSLYDYEVTLEGNTPTGKFKEEELDYEFRIGDLVELAYSREIGVVTQIDFKYKQVELYHIDGSHQIYSFSQVKPINVDERVMGNLKSNEDIELGKFGELGLDIGKFTDGKNKQYGSSVDATYEMMKVLMQRYEYDEGNYLMPKELLQHILLQVRMMDKINRIFNNPSGKGDKESPYKDITGYGLIGIDMVERSKYNAN